MAVADDFENLCESLCEIAGWDPAAPAVEAHGMRSLRRKLQDVSIALTSAPHRPGMAFLSVHMPAGGERDWTELLCANMEMTWDRKLTFSLSPDGCWVVLHRAWPLPGTSAHEVLECARICVQIAHEWQASGTIARPAVPDGRKGPQLFV